MVGVREDHQSLVEAFFLFGRGSMVAADVYC